MTDEQGKLRLGQGVERAGPRVQCNRAVGVEFAQAVVEFADGWSIRQGERAEQLRQRAVRRAAVVGEAGENRGGEGGEKTYPPG